MTGRPTLAVLMGGRSSEHEVSLSSAEAVIAALDADRYDVVPVLIGREGGWSVHGAPVAVVPAPDGSALLASLDGGAARPVHAVFPVLHGPNGEDGTVQGLLETANVPYVGAGVAASAVAMDKAMFKVFLRDAGIPTPTNVVVTAAEWAARPDEVRARVAERVGYPAFSKPARLGSSVGISPVPAAADLGPALELAFHHDPKALVERAISGREVEVGVLGGDEPFVSPVGEITYDSEWYDYATKYEPGRSRVQVPADLPEPVAAARAGAGAGGLRGGRLRRPGPGRLLRRRGRRGAAVRAQHHARVHAHQRLREAHGGRRHPLPRARRAARAPGPARAPRPPAATPGERRRPHQADRRRRRQPRRRVPRRAAGGGAGGARRAATWCCTPAT